MNATPVSGNAGAVSRKAVAKWLFAGAFLLAIGAAVGALAYHALLRPKITPSDLQQAFLQKRNIDANLDGVAEKVVSLTPTRAVTIESRNGQPFRILYSLENRRVTPLLCYPDDYRVIKAIETIQAISLNGAVSPTEKVRLLADYRRNCSDDALMTLALYSCATPELNQFYGQTMVLYEREAFLSAPQIYVGAKLLDAGLKGWQDYQKRCEAARQYGCSVENPRITWRPGPDGKYVIENAKSSEAVKYESDKNERWARAEAQRREFETSVQTKLEHARAQAGRVYDSTRTTLGQTAQNLNQAVTDWQRNASQQQRQNQQQMEAWQRQTAQEVQNRQRQADQALQNLGKAAGDVGRQLNQAGQQIQKQIGDFLSGQRKK